MGISFLALFLQMVLIRFLAIELVMFTFFKNFVLMACFLGLGVGLGLARSERNLAIWFAPACTLLLLLALFGDDLGLNEYFLPTGNNAFQFIIPPATDWWTLGIFYCLFVVLLLIIVAVFVPLGQRLGRLFAELPPSTSYTWDLTGSILGVLAYTALSFWGVSPKIAAVASVAAALCMFLGDRRGLALTACCVIGLAVVFATCNTKPAPSGMDDPRLTPVSSKFLWSPYYRIHWESLPVSGSADKPVFAGYRGFLNGFYYFDLLDLRLASDPQAMVSRFGTKVPLSTIALHYSVPYYLRPGTKSVLILGGGPGNDAAAALLNGADDITAVEIDPQVAWLGHHIHPMRPYEDPRVKVDINDARAHLARETRRFDLVSFGHLDSIVL
ncbi:MAG TPA: hypothetical protein VGO93_24635, partial [Candidatus Xenobia bacterium]